MFYPLSHLTLNYFRSYAHFQHTFQEQLIIITGSNGSGKTNLLEALSFLSPGRGLRQAHSEHLHPHQKTNDDANILHIPHMQISFQTDTGPLDFTIKWHMRGRINTLNQHILPRQINLMDHVALAWLTPAIERLFAQSRRDRRMFFDRLHSTLDASYAHYLMQYTKVMHARLKLLTQDAPYDALWVTQLEKQSGTYAYDMLHMRTSFLNDLNNWMQNIDPRFPRGVLKRQSNCPSSSYERHTWIDAWMQAQKNSRYIDKNARKNTIGLHRDHILMIDCSHNQDAHYGSTGEQKALVVGVMLAFFQKLNAQNSHRPTLLLLDDIASHLDATRRQALYDMLPYLNSQIWMTGTDPSFFQELQGKGAFFRLNYGKLS